ncbi:uncharacterized protein LOC119596783, partial [Penaeus monodon]|uniref:uncharacterized protein LOC119596783 n=1 Tax=Penaeus monodon TaxID=6687 RepID=UPI0018A7824D
GRKKVQLHLPPWFSVYMLANSALVFSYAEMMGRIKARAYAVTVTLGMACRADHGLQLQFRTPALGRRYDGRRYGAFLEVLRLLLFFGVSYWYPMFGSATTVRRVSWMNLLSLLMWPVVAILTFRRAEKSWKTKPQPGEAAKRK